MEILLLQAASSGGGLWSTVLMMVAIFVVAYFFMIRPQQKKQKEIEKARASLSKGDSIVTAGGIYGKITKIHDDCFEIEIDNNVNIRIDKASVFKSMTK